MCGDQPRGRFLSAASSRCNENSVERAAGEDNWPRDFHESPEALERVRFSNIDLWPLPSDRLKHNIGRESVGRVTAAARRHGCGTGAIRSGSTGKQATIAPNCGRRGFSDAGPFFPGSPAIGSQRLSGWRAGPSADAVRLRQMAWVVETAKMLPPHALYQQCVTLYVCSNAKFC